MNTKTNDGATARYLYLTEQQYGDAHKIIGKVPVIRAVGTCCDVIFASLGSRSEEVAKFANETLTAVNEHAALVRVAEAARAYSAMPDDGECCRIQEAGEPVELAANLYKALAALSDLRAGKGAV